MNDPRPRRLSSIGMTNVSRADFTMVDTISSLEEVSARLPGLSAWRVAARSRVATVTPAAADCSPPRRRFPARPRAAAQPPLHARVGRPADVELGSTTTFLLGGLDPLRLLDMHRKGLRGCGRRRLQRPREHAGAPVLGGTLVGAQGDRQHEDGFLRWGAAAGATDHPAAGNAIGALPGMPLIAVSAVVARHSQQGQD